MKNRKEEKPHETSQEVGALHKDYSLPYYMPNYDDENYNEAYRGGYRLFGTALQDLYNKHCIPKSRYPLDIDTLKEAARDSFEGIFDTFFEQFYQ